MNQPVGFWIVAATFASACTELRDVPPDGGRALMDVPGTDLVVTADVPAAGDVGASLDRAVPPDVPSVDSGQAPADVAADARPPCTAPRTLCAGVCVDGTTDDANCGRCGLRCPAGQICSGGACSPPAACGASGQACCPSGTCGAGFTCTAGTCVPSDPCASSTSCVTCTPRNGCGWCGATGACVSITTCSGPAVGTCSSAFACNLYQCPGAACGPTNRTGACPPGPQQCVAGVCVVLAPPRPLAPANTATVTSQRPTLRVRLAPGTDGFRVQICSDPYCERVEQQTDLAGSSVVANQLAPGVHFWRLLPRAGAVLGASTSPTWQFTVGHRSAPVASSWGATGDHNGDGFDDIIVGAPPEGGGPGHAYFYLGAQSGLGTSPASLTSPEVGGDEFGAAVANAGDVDGDGYAEFLVGAPGHGGGTGRAYIYNGAARIFRPTPTWTLPAPDAGTRFGYSVAGAGDLNGDGYADVVVGTFYALSGRGRAYVYFGSASGLAMTPTTLTGPEPDGWFGYAVAGAGDVNGDGYADLAVGAYNAQSGTGRTYIYLGSASGLGLTPVMLMGPDPGGHFGASVASAGDVNGDGYADLVVGAGTLNAFAGRAYVYLGGAGGFAPAMPLLAPDGGAFGAAVAGAGDVNGDGYADVLVGAQDAMSRTGRAYIYLGNASGIAPSPRAISGPAIGARFGSTLAGAGDVNGDGYADVVIGAYGNGAGQAYVAVGDASSILLGPSPLLSAPPDAARFGFSVASMRGPIGRLFGCEAQAWWPAVSRTICRITAG